MKKKLFVFITILLFLSSFAGCKINGVVPADGKYTIDSLISGNTSSSVQGLNIYIEISKGKGFISSIFVGAPKKIIEFRGDGSFVTPDCTGTWSIYKNKILNTSELRLKGLKYNYRTDDWTNPNVTYAFVK